MQSRSCFKTLRRERQSHVPCLPAGENCVAQPLRLRNFAQQAGFETASRNVVKRLAFLLVLGALVYGCSGCAYMQHRGEDALDMIDIGVTVSEKPGFAFYYDFIPVVPIGVGYVDGYFAGLGGGRVGWMRHYERSFGLILWGQEEVGYRKFTSGDKDSLNFQRSGLVGLIQGPIPGPDYMISCPHYLHLGWIGLVGSPRYLQALDFLLGFTTLDICGDDGRPRGYWPWDTPPESGVAGAFDLDNLP